MASGVVDEGMMDSSSGVDQGFLESVGIVDEGSVESRSSEGQGVGGVDQSRVRFRLGQGHGDKSENYKELHAEACLESGLSGTDCDHLTDTSAFIRFSCPVLLVSAGPEKPGTARGQG